MTKKAMSPLFSTIILIGFAIALGGIVMSWGRAGYAPEREIVVCAQTSLSLVDYGENRGICNKGNILLFTMQNDGEIDIDGIKVVVVGSNEIYSSVIDKQINVADIVKLDLQYPDIGRVEKVMFTPKFTYSGKERLCPKNGFSMGSIGEC